MMTFMYVEFLVSKQWDSILHIAYIFPIQIPFRLPKKIYVQTIALARATCAA